MANNVSHTTEYRVLAKVLLVLLLMTLLTITVTTVHLLGAFSVAIALLIACFKVFMVLTYFMHLKYESVLLRVLVGFVFVLFALIIVITFADYAFR
jgi:cytochrome c oxidase subunit IV